jgi:hypothetical protein
VSGRVPWLRPGAARSDMALVALLAVAACAASELLPAGLAAVRVPLVLPLVLVLPGYAAVTALFAPGALRASERVVLSLALSIAATILSGLAVDLAGAKLTASPWLEVLGALTLAAAVSALARGHARPLRAPALRLRAIEIAALVAAAALIAAAAAIGFRPLAPPARTQGTAALGLLEAPAGAAAVCVSVINEQFHVADYRVAVTVAPARNRTFGPIRLAPGASWYRLVAVGPGLPVVRATLFRASAPGSPYRHDAITAWAPYLRAKHC